MTENANTGDAYLEWTIGLLVALTIFSLVVIPFGPVIRTIWDKEGTASTSDTLWAFAIYFSGYGLPVLTFIYPYLQQKKINCKDSPNHWVAPLSCWVMVALFAVTIFWIGYSVFWMKYPVVQTVAAQLKKNPSANESMAEVASKWSMSLQDAISYYSIATMGVLAVVLGWGLSKIKSS